MMELKDISFGYNKDVNVIRDISLNIEDGDFVGILGPNGSGKTTLLKIIAGVLKPTFGDVFVDNERLSSLGHNKRAKKIAVVPQENSIPFSFSALEVVLMGRSPYLPIFGFESKEDILIARQAMEDTDTLGFANRALSELSGGEKQRVIVSRALAQKSKILLLDEPATFLDIRHQMDLFKLLKKKNHDERLTIISVMHDINFASIFCNRIIFLKEGHLAANGAPHEVVKYAMIRDVFNTDVFVGINDLTGMPYYVPKE